MKLRYYLRGLGIGIVVTALIFVITPREKETLSDAEIRERAEQLGMVDSSSLTLAAIQGAAESEEAAEKESAGEEQTAGATEETTLAGAEESAGAQQPSEGAESAGMENPTEGAGIAGTESSPGNAAEAQPVTITIMGGADSYSVCKDLEAAGLIEDALDFDTYLCNIGYSKSINAGTYEIAPGTSREEIAKIITKKR